ncbi:MAG: hypothetical protein JAZ06_07570 [Candidatus Thiodiazotropha taylori]|nr:hypothetical protein [Candidatus Thiodiazotropha taylori]
MFAIAVLLIVLLYLVSVLWISWWFAKQMNKRGRSGKKWGVGVFVLMLGIVFWDWMPMEILYKYNCNANAGFFKNISIDEWKAENPGVWETLGYEVLPEEYFVSEKQGRKKSRRRFYLLPDGTELIAYYDIAGKYYSTKIVRSDGIKRYWLNQRFYWESVWTKHLFHIREIEDRIVDMQTEAVIARYVDFKTSIVPLGVGASDLSDYKIWMHKETCEDDG